MVNDARFVGAVRRLAALQPDFEYVAPVGGRGERNCMYVHDGVPSCLVGQALVAVGHSVAELAKFDSDHLDAETVLTELGYGWRTAAWANEAQTCQDAGDHWRDAVRKADGRVRENGGAV